MSEVIVSKAGGTSNADAAAVEQALGWAEESRIFVVSAPGKLEGGELADDKVTNMLLRARDSYLARGEVSNDYTDAITERFAAIVGGLGGSALPGTWLDKIPTRIEEAARQSEDTASMLGERLQAEVYESLGYTLLDPGQAPRALRSDPDAWRGWLSEIVDDGRRYVLPGNTTLVDGHLETFSRGGSDTSGGLASYGVSADLHLNLTDHGALSANPQYIDRARLVHIPHLLYAEGRELGRNGTGLLHPAAMVPLMRGDIPTEIRGTFDREAPETLLDNDTERAAQRGGMPVAVSLMEDVVMHRIHEPGMAEAVGRLAAFEGALAEHGIPLVDTQGDGVDGQKYFVEAVYSAEGRRVLKDLTSGSIESSDNLSLLTLVGYELETRLIDNIFSLVWNSGINPKEWQTQGHDFSVGKHSLRISATPKPAAVGMLRKIHQAFLEGSPDDISAR